MLSYFGLTFCILLLDSENLSAELKHSTKERYGNVFVTFERSTLEMSKPNKREDIIVGLSLIKDAKKTFFQTSESDNINLEIAIYRENPLKKMRAELQNVSAAETDYSDIITSSSDYVIVSGAPGCGKSTLCETLAYNWACNELWTRNPNFKFVFLLRFRLLNRFKDNPDVTAERILAEFYPEYFNEAINKTNDNTLLILDGFDEYFDKQDLCRQDYEFTNYTRALYDLLNPYNKGLPFARLVTSRPGSCHILFKILKEEQYTNLRLFEITGFNMENIRKYVTHYFQQNSSTACLPSTRTPVDDQRLHLFLQKIKESEILRSLMTIPFYCNGVCNLMLDSEIDIKSIPITYTALFCNLLTIFIRNHGYRNSKQSLSAVLKNESTKQMILVLSQFAFILEKKGKITFSEKDLPNGQTNIEELVEKTGLIVRLDEEDEPAVYQFLHYSFHEFLVALYCFHVGLILDWDKVYILPMEAGLAGGLVDESRSNLFVQKYSRMFQSTQPIGIKDFFKDGCNNKKFTAVVFEYRNSFYLEKLTLRLQGISFDSKHYHV